MWELLIGIILVPVAFVVAYLFAIMRYVKPPEEWVVEINIPGKDTKKIKWEPGLHFLWVPIRPFMYVRSKVPVNKQKEVLRVGEEEGLGTSGKIELANASAAIVAQVVFRVIDPIAATYEIDDYRSAVINKIESLIRQLLGGKDLDEALKEDTKKNITDYIKDESNSNGIRSLMASWGVELDDVSIIDFVLDEETDRKRREILNAKKDADAEVLRAKGRKKARVAEAKGEAEAIRLMAEAERIRQALLGEGQGDYIKAIADKTGSSIEEVMAFIRSEQFFEAIKGSTIFSMSEGGGLNFPASFAAVFKAFSEGMKGKGGTTT